MGEAFLGLCKDVAQYIFRDNVLPLVEFYKYACNMLPRIGRTVRLDLYITIGA